MDKYIVKETMQRYGKMYAVSFEGNYMFLKKTKEEAQAIADRMNAIHKRRLDESNQSQSQF